MSNHDAKNEEVTYERYVTKRDVSVVFVFQGKAFQKKTPIYLKLFVVSNNKHIFCLKIRIYSVNHETGYRSVLFAFMIALNRQM